MGVVLKEKIKPFLFSTAIVLSIALFSGAETAHADAIIRAPNNLGLVGYWSFDEGVGTQAGDLSGNRNEGVLMNDPEWSVGHIGNALTFSGSEWVDLSGGGVNDIGLSGAMTISLWFWADNDNSNQYFLDNRNPGSWWFIKDYTGGPCGSIPNNICFEDRLMATDADWDPGEWTHLVVTDDTTTATMYINGEVVDTGQGESSAISTNLRIGTRYSNSGYFQGKMDEVRLYGRALSGAEVQSLYSSSKGTLVGVVPADKYTDGLVLHYTFDGDTLSGSTLGDLAGNNDGTLSGAVPTIGIVGQAMEFGGDDIVDIPNGWGSGVDFTEISGATWVYPTSTSGTKGLLEGRGSDFHWEITSGNWRVRLAGFNIQSATAAPPINEWQHVAFTYNGSSGQFNYYVDGVNVYSSTGNSGTNSFFSSGNTQLGDSNFGTRYWQGKIDDFRIYNRALSAEEIAGLAQGGTGVLTVAPVTGSILMERWEGIGGNGVGSIPVNDPPDYTETRTSFEIPTNAMDNYGARIRGYLYPEESGNYTFWFASDDNGELWLSTDANEANKVRIANVGSYTSSRQWDKLTSQKSAEIPLVAGKKYYIEGLMKEGGGGDNMAVAWKLNDTTNPTNGSDADIIPGSVLSPWVE